MSIAKIVVTTDDATQETTFSIEGNEYDEAYLNAQDVLMMIAEDQNAKDWDESNLH